MAGAERFGLLAKTRLEVALEFNCIKWLSANLAADQVQGLKIIPVVAFDEMLKLHGIGGAYPFAIVAAGTARH